MWAKASSRIILLTRSHQLQQSKRWCRILTRGRAFSSAPRGGGRQPEAAGGAGGWRYSGSSRRCEFRAAGGLAFASMYGCLFGPLRLSPFLDTRALIWHLRCFQDTSQPQRSLPPILRYPVPRGCRAVRATLHAREMGQGATINKCNSVGSDCSALLFWIAGQLPVIACCCWHWLAFLPML